MQMLTKLRFAYNSAPYKQLRIYKHRSFLQLLNDLFVNRMASCPWVVSNSMTIYRISCNVVSTRLTSWMIQNTFGRVFSAGETLAQVESMSRKLRNQNISVIVDYCGEGFIDTTSIQAELDKNAEMFRLTAEETQKHKGEMVSIKVSGLVDMKLLKKLNLGVNKISTFWLKNNKNSLLTGQDLLFGFQNIYGGTNEQDITQFLTAIFNYNGQLQNFKCDQIQFRSTVMPYYIHDRTKTTHRLINLFCPLSEEELTLADNLIRRIDWIVEPFANNKNGFKILVDAEQSYIQDAIFSLSEQYQTKYNKEQVYIVPTLQNYLKISQARVKYEIQLSKRLNFVFAMKYVRGAYLVQERRLASQFKYESPIVQTFELTTENFLTNVKVAFRENLREGSELIVATHSQQTIEQIKKMITEQKHNKKVYFAQLLGLADHLTVQLCKQGYPVYKYLPYGATETMVPYLIRRAQELSQMKYPLGLQYDLIMEEFKHRLGLRS